jgi:hypothetical protein
VQYDGRFLLRRYLVRSVHKYNLPSKCGKFGWFAQCQKWNIGKIFATFAVPVPNRYYLCGNTAAQQFPYVPGRVRF